MSSQLSRRSFLEAGFKAGALAAVAPLALNAVAKLPQAHALSAPIGTVIDYSGGVPDAKAVQAQGHLGAVRYVSEARPDAASWMKGKPVKIAETKAFAAAGLEVASVYQFGRASNADWLQGAAGAALHAPQAIALHSAAGGATGRPIYVAIDDNPSREQYDGQIRPYLQAFKSALESAGLKLGVYGNYNTIEWAVQDGLGEFFWMHDWGSDGRIHPRTTIHQKSGWKETINGIEVDVNNVYAHDWGQWKPGYGPSPTPETIPAIPNTDQLSALLPADLKGVQLPSQQQINDAIALVNQVRGIASS
ncbi:DUF1906 domain-containing protein [Corynebacterium sp. H128]|uniref:DUF1906 domain-containing protein n=1 Tax=unclassified Corynebacterium TaxID=2624378 RepID=UPI0030AFA2C6